MQHRGWISGIVCFVIAAFTATPTARGQTYKILYNFSRSGGRSPYAGVILDSAGNLYGTAPNGGLHAAGVIFKLDPSGNETVLYNFTGGADGGHPGSGVIRDSDGNLYGTTSAGGLCAGCGVVFELDAAGNETTLYSFTGGTDGGRPVAVVALDSAGNLYGTTSADGITTGKCATLTSIPGCGVLFKLDTAGNETVLHSFTGRVDGGKPGAGVILDSAGNIYGTDEYGAKCRGCGVAFKVDAAGNLTVLHSFGGSTDGIMPMSGLIQDSAGNLYGTTEYGGVRGGLCGNGGCGTVFKVDTAGSETVLYRFTGSDGSIPLSSLVQDSAGNLYGTAYAGGVTTGTCATLGGNGMPGCGLVFKLGATGDLTLLHTFTGPDGASPMAGLTLDSAGNLYGTTQHGGASGGGVIFKLTP